MPLIDSADLHAVPALDNTEAIGVLVRDCDGLQDLLNDIVVYCEGNATDPWRTEEDKKRWTDAAETLDKIVVSV